jgi:hypothetical protein
VLSLLRLTSPRPSAMSPLLRLTSSRHSTVARFLPMKPRWTRYLRFIFSQCFIMSPPLSSQNRSIKSTPPSLTTLPDRPTHTLHYYKKVISTLVTLSTAQPRLYFASSLARAPRHRISTYRRHSLSSSSHVYRSSTQRHPRRWISRASFTSRATYWYVNTHKYKISWNSAISREIIN